MKYLTSICFKTYIGRETGISRPANRKRKRGNRRSLGNLSLPYVIHNSFYMLTFAFDYSKQGKNMQLPIERKDINKFLLIGDKVLVKPKNPQSQTKTGLYLPPTVQEKEKIQCGYVIKTGPGYAIPSQNEDLEVWESKENREALYIPLQAKTGDLAIYLQNASFEIAFNDEKYIIVPHSAILMLIREDDLFE